MDHARAHVVLDDADIGRALSRIAHEIVEKRAAPSRSSCSASPPAASPSPQRIAAAIASIEGTDVPVGALDITMYRDDLRLRPARALEPHRPSRRAASTARSSSSSTTCCSPAARSAPPSTP